MRGHVHAKLPKWAQQEISRLERDLAAARAKLVQGPEGSRVFADPYSDVPRPLGEHTIIEFELPGGRVRARIDGDQLDVDGDGVLHVHPRAANSIRLTTG